MSLTRPLHHLRLLGANHAPPSALWEYQSTHAGVLPDDASEAPALEAIANTLLTKAEVNKQALPTIQNDLVE